MKRAFRIAFLVLAFCMAAPLSAYAGEAETTIKVGGQTYQADAGGTVQIPVTIENNAGFTAMVVTLDYDKDALTLTGIDASDSLIAENAVTNTDLGTVGFVSGTSASGDGTLFIATFEVNEGTANGQYTVDASLRGNRSRNLVNVSRQNQTVAFQSGTIIVGPLSGSQNIQDDDGGSDLTPTPLDPDQGGTLLDTIAAMLTGQHQSYSAGGGSGNLVAAAAGRVIGFLAQGTIADTVFEDGVMPSMISGGDSWRSVQIFAYEPFTGLDQDTIVVLNLLAILVAILLPAIAITYSILHRRLPED